MKDANHEACDRSGRPGSQTGAPRTYGVKMAAASREPHISGRTARGTCPTRIAKPLRSFDDEPGRGCPRYTRKAKTKGP